MFLNYIGSKWKMERCRTTLSRKWEHTTSDPGCTGRSVASGPGRWSSPSTMAWWGHISSALFTSGLPSSTKTWKYWRESSAGLQRWWGDWSVSLLMRKGWGTCLAWRSLHPSVFTNTLRKGVRGWGQTLSSGGITEWKLVPPLPWSICRKRLYWDILPTTENVKKGWDKSPEWNKHGLKPSGQNLINQGYLKKQSETLQTH